MLGRVSPTQKHFLWWFIAWHHNESRPEEKREKKHDQRMWRNLVPWEISQWNRTQNTCSPRLAHWEAESWWFLNLAPRVPALYAFECDHILFATGFPPHFGGFLCQWIWSSGESSTSKSVAPIGPTFDPADLATTRINLCTPSECDSECRSHFHRVSQKVE